MNAKMLKTSITLSNLSVDEVIEGLNDAGVKMSKAVWFRRMKGTNEFTRSEIEGLSKVLELTPEEVIAIFFKD